jgi:hypothetical protein
MDSQTPSAPDKKICPVCCSVIALKARKCPCCQSYQDARSKIASHPLLGVMIGVIPMVIVFSMFFRMFGRGESFENHRTEITLHDAQIRFGETERGPTVAVMGVIRNASKVPWKDVNIHVEFQDASGNRVDVADRTDSYFQLPPEGASAFKVSILREFPQSAYVKSAIAVVSAKDARARH